MLWGMPLYKFIFWNPWELLIECEGFVIHSLDITAVRVVVCGLTEGQL